MVSGVGLILQSAPYRKKRGMLSGKMIERYSDFEAWLHDFFVGNRAVNLHQHVLQQTRLADVFADGKPRRVLDVGCGGGQSILHLKAQYPHLELSGIDLSEPQIERARVRARRQGCAAQFEVADAQALPFPDQQFDVVYSFGSVKHWPDPQRGIAECWRVLRDGGELLLTDSTSDATHEQVVRFYNLARLPSLLEKPVVALVQQIIVRPARPMSVYQQIEAHLKLPPGTVTQAQYMPAFIFRTRKPFSGSMPARPS